MIWAYLIHLGYNMWDDRGDWHRPVEGEEIPFPPRTYLRCEEDIFDLIVEKIKDAGMNMLVIDLGEGIKYKSHPEISVKGSWSVKKMKRKIEKIKKMGIEPIPKLNFSATHDNWLGKYSRCVSTDIYYKVCKELISEVAEIFDRPRFFHLGMDEETCEHQKNYLYICVRQYELWWNDFYFLLNEVEKKNMKGWIWSDYFWRNRDDFIRNMPKTVIQSNWYYGNFEKEDICIRTYIELDKNGFYQIPTGSNDICRENFKKTVEFCLKNIERERILGFLQTVWRPTIKHFYERHLEAINVVKQTIEYFKNIT
jgi:hypothetical protein